MSDLREKLTFEFLQVLHAEHLKNPIPSHTVDFDHVWSRVTDRHPKLDSETASAAFNTLYAGRWINQWTDESGKKLIQINEAGIAAYRELLGVTKSEKKEQEERHWKLLGALIAIAGLAFAVMKYLASGE